MKIRKSGKCGYSRLIAFRWVSGEHYIVATVGKPLNSSLFEPSVTNMGHMFALFIQEPSGSRYTQPGPSRAPRVPPPRPAQRSAASTSGASSAGAEPAPKGAPGPRRAVPTAAPPRGRGGTPRAFPAGSGRGGGAGRGRPWPPPSLGEGGGGRQAGLSPAGASSGTRPAASPAARSVGGGFCSETLAPRRSAPSALGTPCPGCSRSRGRSALVGGTGASAPCAELPSPRPARPHFPCQTFPAAAGSAAPAPAAPRAGGGGESTTQAARSPAQRFPPPPAQTNK